MRHALSLAAAAVVLTACLRAPEERLPSCEQLAEEQPECMDDEAIADCIEANDTCASDGEVRVEETCPLEFTCEAVGTI